MWAMAKSDLILKFVKVDFVEVKMAESLKYKFKLQISAFNIANIFLP